MTIAYSPIFDLIRANDVDAVSALLATDPSLVSARDVDLATPLHIATAYGQTEIVRLLLQYSADVNACTATGETPLFDISRAHSVAIAALLIEHGTDVNHHADLLQTPLSDAIHNDNVSLVQFLIAQGADIHTIIQDIDEQTPLLLALDRERPIIATLLLDHHVELGQIDFRGRTALHYAAEHGYREIVARLLVLNMDTAVRDEAGKTALDYAQARLEDFQQIIYLLRTAR